MKTRMTVREAFTAALLVMVLLAAIALTDVPGAANAQQADGLRVQNGVLTRPTGERFVVSGVNLETWRDSGCGWFGDQQWQRRVALTERLRGLGVNAVRLNYSYSFLGRTPSNLTRFLDLAEGFARAGMFVMPSDHSFTGKNLTSRSTAWPMMKQITEGLRARGVEQALIWNPYNEPGPDNAWPAWVTAQVDTIAYLRSLGFSGLIVLDSPSWAASWDAGSYRQVLAVDQNVAFSNHWYPNISLSNVQAAQAGGIANVIGELGQYNPGVTGITPSYVQSVLRWLINTGIPGGHSGAFAWIWSWCDDNGMTSDNYFDGNETSAFIDFSDHGRIWEAEYFSKLRGNTTIPTAAFTLVPSRTAAPATNTPRPVRTATAAPSSTPVPTATAIPTAAPTASAGSWEIEFSIVIRRK